MAYLDDIFILSSDDISTSTLDFFQSYPDLGICANPDKCHQYDLADETVLIEILGSYMGPNPHTFLVEKVDELLRQLRLLESSSSTCIASPSMVFTASTKASDAHVTFHRGGSPRMRTARRCHKAGCFEAARTAVDLFAHDRDIIHLPSIQLPWLALSRLLQPAC